MQYHDDESKNLMPLTIDVNNDGTADEVTLAEYIRQLALDSSTAENQPSL